MYSGRWETQAKESVFHSMKKEYENERLLERTLDTNEPNLVQEAFWSVAVREFLGSACNEMHALSPPR